MPAVTAADLFCGAGGTSRGMIKAADARALKLDLVAVNHWPTAVATHAANHTWARHVCADLASVEADPSHLIPAGRLDLLVASPECTHHSNARGGKPKSEQSRASAWHVLHWAERLHVDNVLVENVREFETWGPLLDRTIRYRGRTYKRFTPDPRRRGETFTAFANALRSLGYVVEWKVLNAADYGDATTRRRLFVQARRRGSIHWPEATHAGRWRPARDVIDWSMRGSSIFTRKRPLSPNTLKRIEAGLKRFGGEPFLTIMRGSTPGHCSASAKSVGEPVPTITAGGSHMYLAEPFIIPMEHSQRNALRSTSDPLPTITTARGGAFGLCEPFVLQVAHAGGDRVRSLDEPLPTIPAGHRGELAVCEPFITKYYGQGSGARPVSDPLDTITTKDRFALVEPTKMDILFRMLQPTELAAAMGFDDYHFTGNKTEVVRQIGNAVSVRTAEALCGSIFDSLAVA